MGPMKGLIEQWLKEDANRPRKQRHTARRIYRRLVEEHQFPGSESSVRKYVQKLRGEGVNGSKNSPLLGKRNFPPWWLSDLGCRLL